MRRILCVSAFALLLGACSMQPGGEQAASSSAMSAMPSKETKQASSATVLHIRWKETGTKDTGEPINLLMIQDAKGATIASTTCIGVPSQVEDKATSQPVVRCWWAGGGYDYSVQSKNGKPVFIQRFVDEESGFGKWEESPADLR